MDLLLEFQSFFSKEYEVLALHFEDYVLRIKTHGSRIWHAITNGTYKYSKTKEIVTNQEELDDIIANDKSIESDEKNRLMNNLKETRILRFSLPPNSFQFVSSLSTTKQIWDRVKALYSGDADLTHSIQTTLLFEFGSFDLMKRLIKLLIVLITC